MKYILAGNRDISHSILKFLISKGNFPMALIVPDNISTKDYTLLVGIANLPESRIFKTNQINIKSLSAIIKDFKPDYLICIHFPYILPKYLLEIPKIGSINLHPALLPYNRGWHTPSWAILEESPIGATLHFMEETLDSGDIIHQKEINIEPSDTADSLYKRLKKVEILVFKEAYNLLSNSTFKRVKQNKEFSTYHKKSDLLNINFQKINLDESYNGKHLINKLRALTTNRLEEAAYFEVENNKYRIQITITKDDKK